MRWLKIRQYLPALSTLAFGEKDHDSFCFYNADFILTDLPALQSVVLGSECFHLSITTTVENLPNLRDIYLSPNTLVGNAYEKCSLTLKDLPSLKTVRLTGGHFLNVGSFVFESEKRWRLL
ncbi:hypothetical protein AV274_1054 [Blastocystis sp. ATCC 50177/Nand II]|uniref:Uncharacterized protein n=1 Tax=Blastocystis sp. subtype 1 (strain ATCC 50177 / NandII) TaxID=478820 RepID=A0A196SJJ6_BLAHN|nr:hypothetical protein AV274_1054 [Blastocystis sp. ATCC 50177/Nand II]